MRRALVVGLMCSCSSDEIVPGWYAPTSSSACGSPTGLISLQQHGDGSLSVLGVTVTEQSGGLAGELARAECASRYPSVSYDSWKLESIGDSTLHVTRVTATQQVALDACTEDAARALASSAPVCELDAKLSTPAPRITSISPSTLNASHCTDELSISGSDFAPDAIIGFEMTGIGMSPADGYCRTPWPDGDYNTVCELVGTATSSSRIGLHLDACFPAGDLTLVVRNPYIDGPGATEAYVHLKIGN